MQKKPRILVVGSFVMDVIATTEQIPRSAQTVYGKSFHMAPGGKGANQALQCARLGADVTMMGCVGDDLFGERLLEPLKSAARHVAPRERTYRFRLDGSIDHVTAVGLTFDEDSVTYTMTDDRGTHSVRAGLDRWISGETSMTGAYLHHQYEMDRAKISACAYWSDEKTLTMAWRYPEMAFFDHLSITWEETGLRINRWVNMNSQDRRRPELTVAF